MYTSYSLTKAIFTALQEYDHTDLTEVIGKADPEVLADEIFNIMTIMFQMIEPAQRSELERRLFRESTSYDFDTLTSYLPERFIFKKQEPKND